MNIFKNQLSKPQTMLLKSFLIVSSIAVGTLSITGSHSLKECMSEEVDCLPTEITILDDSHLLVPAVIYKNEIIPDILLETIEITPEPESEAIEFLELSIMLDEVIIYPS